MTGAFAEWQPRYAAQRVVTFPVNTGSKKPAVTNYLKMGAKASSQLVFKFPDAEAIGFACGPRNRITIVDVDSPDEAVIKESERLFGSSPVMWRTGSGNFAMAFRHHGEARRIRPIAGLPIDLLGVGFVVAPPSVGKRQPYEFIRGGLADFGRLPHARIPREIANSNVISFPRDRTSPERIPEGRREDELFKFCQLVERHCDDLEALVDAATTFRDNRLELLPAISDARVRATCVSVWNYRGARKRMVIYSGFLEVEQQEELWRHSYAGTLFAYLAMHEGAGAHFMVADGLGEKLGWPTRRLPAARKTLLDLKIIERLRGRAPGSPAIYRWAIPHE